jgi:hypothetical protein
MKGNTLLFLGLIILLIVLFYPRNKENFSTSCPDIDSFDKKYGPSKEKYKLESMYQYLQSPGNVGEDCPYYKRGWEECNPCGVSSLDNNCQNQSFVEPENLPKYPIGKFEGFEANQSSWDIKRDTLSCAPECKTRDLCAQDPFNQHYDDPKWRQKRFWNEQEWAPGLPGEPMPLYPTPNMTS